MTSNELKITTDQVKAALQSVLAALEQTENKATLARIKEQAGNDLVKLMQDTLPVLVQIQQKIIKSYGFPDNVSGVLKFTKACQLFEKKDEEIAELSNKLKTNLVPPMPRMPVYIPQNNMKCF